MNQRAAFNDTIELADARGMQYVDGLWPNTTFLHIVNMRDRVAMDRNMSETKIGRWLGWAQCAVVASGVATLDEMKAINQKHVVDAQVLYECKQSGRWTPCYAPTCYNPRRVVSER